ncbi:MAG: UDP-3-O-(3-hydroxymyristoyl)glucosamine N-acyltransferase [Deltaproteobacteria bacterium]|nr:UDP-3-O-(3-hydroxymyristoyl)glucosamine N-acyltransferase [Deltaproteobacteria bacterium]
MAKLRDLAAIVDGRVVGDDQREIGQVASVADVRPDEITYAVSPAFLDKVRAGNAGAVIVREAVEDLAIPQLVAADPKGAAIRLAEYFAPPIEPANAPMEQTFVHAEAQVDETAIVGAGVYVGKGTRVGPRTVLLPGTVVMEHVTIGADGRLGPCATVYARCTLGDRVILHAGVVIGADGFGYEPYDGRHNKIPHHGTVIIENDVEIGANSCVDRATVGRTVVGEGTKIDNQVQVAHNCRIGKNCILVAQTGLGGSTVVGDWTILGARAGVADNVTIGAMTLVAAGTGVINDLPEGSRVAGIPAVPAMEWKRNSARIRQLSKTAREIVELRKRLEALEAETADGDET